MIATTEGNLLVLKIPMQTPAASKSGKSLVVATSGGNKTTTVIVAGKPVIVGLNAYIKS